MYLPLASAALALALSMLVTPLAARLALRMGRYDRHSAAARHSAPTLPFGGLAVVTAMLLATFWVVPGSPFIWVLTASAAMAAFVGLIDDTMTIRPAWRLLALLPAPAVALLLWPEPIAHPTVFIPVFIAGFLFVSNAMALLDNTDGSTCLIVAIAAGALGAMELASGFSGPASAAFAMSGACLGLLCLNWRWICGATVPLGNMGATGLGATVFVIVAHLVQHATAPMHIAAALLPVGLVVVNVVAALCCERRNAAKTPGPTPEAISQRLHRAGIPRIEVAMWMGLVVLTASVAGIAAWSSPDTYFGLGAVILGAVIIGYLVFYSLRLQLPAEATPWHQEHTVCRIVTRLDVGGAAQHCIYLAEGMQKIGWRSYLIHGSIDPAQEESMEYLLEGRGIEAYVAPTMQREVQPIADIRALVSIYRVIRRIRPQIVDTHQAKAGTIGRLAAALCGVPIIVHTYHGISLRDYFGPLKNRFFFWIERICGAMSTALITVGPNDRDELVDIGVAPPGKFAAIPYGLPLRHLADASERRRGELRSELGIGAGELLVLYVGRLVPIKNTPAFIQMAAGVLERRRDVRFVMVGEGPMRPELEKQIAQLGIADKVTLYGVTNDMERIYADADLLVLCSRREGMPLTIMEALAARIPVVATQVGDVTNAVIQGVTGRLVPPGDTDSLTATVLTALEELRQSRDMARVGSEYVLRHFSLEALVDRTDALYRALIANHCYEDPHPFGQDLPEHAATGQR